MPGPAPPLLAEPAWLSSQKQPDFALVADIDFDPRLMGLITVRNKKHSYQYWRHQTRDFLRTFYIPQPDLLKRNHRIINIRWSGWDIPELYTTSSENTASNKRPSSPLHQEQSPSKRARVDAEANSDETRKHASSSSPQEPVSIESASEDNALPSAKSHSPDHDCSGLFGASPVLEPEPTTEAASDNVLDQASSERTKAQPPLGDLLSSQAEGAADKENISIGETPTLNGHGDTSVQTAEQPADLTARLPLATRGLELSSAGKNALNDLGNIASGASVSVSGSESVALVNAGDDVTVCQVPSGRSSTLGEHDGTPSASASALQVAAADIKKVCGKIAQREAAAEATGGEQDRADLVAFERTIDDILVQGRGV
ncbi:hypothetical protein EVJ58_g1100 [Rhodofomes roseus]|uniref:Uncharacterized protein n=1 Tax=Rhodofomes roseus TaxID=34475 RepID=A0A4Y9Z0A0_9APHY|nr:hypothetical protein EVJ58_g1100 [Rhodofomes roseus]